MFYLFFFKGIPFHTDNDGHDHPRQYRCLQLRLPKANRSVA